MSSSIPLSPDVERLARSIRFALVSFIVALSYLPIRAALAIPTFEGIFRDMLNGKPLPPLTTAIIHARDGLIVCSFLIPLFVLGTLFSRRLVVSFYLLGGLCFLILVQSLLLYQGLSAPLFEIVQAMQGSTP